MQRCRRNSAAAVSHITTMPIKVVATAATFAPRFTRTRSRCSPARAFRSTSRSR